MGQTKEIMSIRADTRVGRQCNENIPPSLGEEAGHHEGSCQRLGAHAQLAQTGTRWARAQ